MKRKDPSLALVASCCTWYRSKPRGDGAKVASSSQALPHSGLPMRANDDLLPSLSPSREVRNGYLVFAPNSWARNLIMCRVEATPCVHDLLGPFEAMLLQAMMSFNKPTNSVEIFVFFGSWPWGRIGTALQRVPVQLAPRPFAKSPLATKRPHRGSNKWDH